MQDAGYRKKDRKKEALWKIYMCSHSNAVHISSPDCRKTYLIAQGIGAIKLIIT